MNLREIAKALGLSPATVSVCLFGDPKKVKLSPRTVERVRKFADEAGYVPNRYARKIFYPEKDRTIGIVFKFDSAIARNTPVLLNAMRRLDKAGIEYVIQSCDQKNIVPTIRQVLGMNIRRILIIGFLREKDLEGLEKYQQAELYPLDLVFGEGPENAALPIRCRMGANHDEFFIGLGRRLLDAGLGPLAVDFNIPILFSEHLASEKNVLQHSMKGDYFESGCEIADQVVRLHRRKQCRTVLLRNDNLAVGLIDALLKRGIRVPDDIGVIGFNDSAFSPFAAVPLTTVQVPIQDNLDAALDHLIDGRPLPDHFQTCLRLIERQSCVLTPRSARG